MATLMVIQPTTVHDSKAYAYSHAARMGDPIFVSGQVGCDREGHVVGPDIHAQTEPAFENTTNVLEAAGSGLHKVGMVTIFTTKFEYRSVIHDVRARVFEATGHLSASTLAVVSSLASPEWLVEIEAIAVN